MAANMAKILGQDRRGTKQPTARLAKVGGVVKTRQKTVGPPVKTGEAKMQEIRENQIKHIESIAEAAGEDSFDKDESDDERSMFARNRAATLVDIEMEGDEELNEFEDQMHETYTNMYGAGKKKPTGNSLDRSDSLD